MRKTMIFKNSISNKRGERNQHPLDVYQGTKTPHRLNIAVSFNP